MNDLEKDLRVLLERKFDEVSVPPVAPPEALRRVRRRQAATTAVAAVVAAGVVLGSVVGVRALLPGGREHVLAAPSPITETVNGVTITYPSDWFATPIKVQVAPLFSFALTNFQPATDRPIECPATDAGVPTTAAILYVLETPGGMADQGWPAELRPSNVSSSDQACLEGWTYLRADWATKGREFGAAAVFGPQASEGDRAAMVEAFASMEFTEGSASGSPGLTFVAATGTSGGVQWSLVVRQQRDQGPCLEMRTATSAAGVCEASAPSGQGSGSGEFGFLVGETQGDPSLLFGSVPAEAVGVQMALEGGATIQGQIYPPPDGSGVTSRLFVIPVPPKSRGEVQALDAAGDVVARQSILPPPPTPAGPTGPPPGPGASGDTGTTAVGSAVASPGP